MMITCQHPGCAESDQPTTCADGANLCGLHLRGLQADVSDIARVTALDAMWHHDLLTATGNGTSGRTVPDSRPPLRVAAIISGTTRAVILGWAADLVRTSRALELAEAGRILALNLEALAIHPALGDGLAFELRDAATDCRQTLPDDRWNDEDHDRRQAPLGRCPQPDPRGERARCGGPLRWRTPAWTSSTDDLAAIEVECSRCSDVWGVLDLPHILRVVEPSRRFPVPRSWITSRYGVASDVLRQWVRRGHVKTYADEQVELFDVLKRITEG